MPDRPDRRRHRGGVEEESQGNAARPSCRCAAKASAASQSLGHHIANDAIRDWVFDKADAERRHVFEATPYDVAIIGDYNIGGDAWASRILLEEMGLRVIAQWSGDGPSPSWRTRRRPSSISSTATGR